MAVSVIAMATALVFLIRTKEEQRLRFLLWSAVFLMGFAVLLLMFRGNIAAC